MRAPFHALLVLMFAAASVFAQQGAPPPEQKPVIVKVGFYLLNLNSLDEKTETFEADVYLDFQWKDSRLAFEGEEPTMFVEDAAVDRLKEIWWPHIEFVNTAAPQITNRAIEISPDGTVNYMLGVTATFRSDLDLRRFPFDKQKLVVRLESFVWTEDRVVFEPMETRVGFEKSNTFEGLRVLNVTTQIKPTRLPGWEKNFSEFLAVIEVKRNFMFYLWTVFMPVILTFLITSTIFFIPIEQFSDRIGISLTGLLACIATQFAISLSLPQIDYLTIIDRSFVITYFCIALAVLTSVAEARWLQGDAQKCAKVDRVAKYAIPAIYFGLLLTGMYF